MNMQAKARQRRLFDRLADRGLKLLHGDGPGLRYLPVTVVLPSGIAIRRRRGTRIIKKSRFEFEREFKKSAVIIDGGRRRS